MLSTPDLTLVCAPRAGLTPVPQESREGNMDTSTPSSGIATIYPAPSVLPATCSSDSNASQQREEVEVLQAIFTGDGELTVVRPPPQSEPARGSVPVI